MTKDDLFAAIGCYVGEPAVTQLLNHLQISGHPKLPRDDDVTFLVDKAKGVEVAFTDASALEEPFASARDFPDGALVVTSIDFNGRPGRKVAVFQGELPERLQFGMSREDVIGLLGPWDKEAMDGDTTKWIEGHKCLICEFDDRNLSQVACQMVLTGDLE